MVRHIKRIEEGKLLKTVNTEALKEIIEDFLTPLTMWDDSVEES